MPMANSDEHQRREPDRARALLLAVGARTARCVDPLLPLLGLGHCASCARAWPSGGRGRRRCTRTGPYGSVSGAGLRLNGDPCAARPPSGRSCRACSGGRAGGRSLLFADRAPRPPQRHGPARRSPAAAARADRPAAAASWPGRSGAATACAASVAAATAPPPGTAGWPHEQARADALGLAAGTVPVTAPRSPSAWTTRRPGHVQPTRTTSWCTSRTCRPSSTRCGPAAPRR